MPRARSPGFARMGKRGSGDGGGKGARTPFALRAVATIARETPQDVDRTYHTLVRLGRAYKTLKEAIAAVKNTRTGHAVAEVLADTRKKAVPDPDGDPRAPRLGAAYESHRDPEVPKGGVMQLLEMAREAGAPDVRETVAAVLNGRLRVEGDPKLYLAFDTDDEYTGHAQTLAALGMRELAPVLSRHLAERAKQRKARAADGADPAADAEVDEDEGEDE